jgi:hypothetical protein
MVPRITYVPKWSEVTRGWRKPRNEVFHSWYYSLNIIRMVNSGWTTPYGMRGTEVVTMFQQKSLMERDHQYDQDVDGRIILKWVF